LREVEVILQGKIKSAASLDLGLRLGDVYGMIARCTLDGRGEEEGVVCYAGTIEGYEGAGI